MKIYKPDECLPVYPLTKDGITLWKWTNEKSEALHMHEFIGIVYVLSGKAIHTIDGTAYTAERGDFLFINYHSTHSIQTIGKCTYCNILILPSLLNSEIVNSENALNILLKANYPDFCDNIQSFPPYLHFQKNEAVEIEAILDSMFEEYKNRENDYISILKSYMNILFIKVLRKIQLEDKIGFVTKNSTLSPKIIEYIKKNCFDKISLEQLAKKCSYNPSYFSRMFRESYGMTLTQFIQKQRISKAQYLLVNSNMSISKICIQVGYNDKTQFYKIFMKYSVGMLPNEYRKKYRPELFGSKPENQ